MRGLPPWFLALCILVIISAIGASIVYSFHGLQEGFSSDACDDCEDDTVSSCVEPSASASASAAASAKDVATLYQGMDQNIAVSSPPLAYSSPSDVQNTDAKFQNLLQAIHQRTGNSGIFPTDANLSMAANSSQDASGQHHGTYTPNQQTIYPHDFPPQNLPTLTANVPTDAGTQAEAIKAGQILTPSIRQMIRSDVKNAIKDQVNDLQNEYEITYEQQ
jgi:hypothetical protein